MIEFKAGDRVKCVNDSEHASDYLEYGRVYFVDRVVDYMDVPPHLKLIGVEKHWCHDRFVKVDDANEPVAASVHRFESGAVRGTDSNGTRFDLISPVALEALAETYAEGAAKYGDNNWLKGIPTSDLLNHALRHLNMWQRGDTSEPHLAHAAWNVLAMIHFERTRPELVVRPYATASEKGGVK